MNKARVKLQAERKIYVHNDLANAAYYFKSRIDSRMSENDREGIGLEIMAGLTMLAFSVEAKVNFLGYKLIKDWNERAAALAKVATVCDRLEIKPDFEKRPFLSIQQLKDFRDTLAHGKPIELCLNEEVVATMDELEEMKLLKPDWESTITHEFLTLAHEDVDCIWKMLLTRSKLEVFDTLTHGSHTVSFIENVDGD